MPTDPSEPVQLNRSEFDSICQKAFIHCHGIGGLELLSNGAVNTTYKFRRHGEPYVLRIYVRDPSRCEIERRIARLVASQVSVPEWIYSDAQREPYPIAIFRFVPGEHLSEIRDGSLAPELSYELGRTLANIHRIRFSKAGLFGLGIVFAEGGTPYYQYIKENLAPGSLVWERLEDQQAEQVLRFIDDQKEYFPVIGGGGSLVHSDFKPVNLLWSPSKPVTVLDWEFAHSGDPLLDFSILLRHFSEFPLQISDLERGYLDHGGRLPEDWIRRARLLDLVNIVQLLENPTHRPCLHQRLISSLRFTFDNWERLEQRVRNLDGN